MRNVFDIARTIFLCTVFATAFFIGGAVDSGNFNGVHIAMFLLVLSCMGAYLIKDEDWKKCI